MKKEQILILTREDLVIGREKVSIELISKEDFNNESMTQMKQYPLTLFQDTDYTKKVLLDRWGICKTN